MKTRDQREAAERLRKWQDRFARAKSAYEPELAAMDQREALYAGKKAIAPPVVPDDPVDETPLVHNIVAELIEAQIDSNIPTPKVTPRRQRDESLAETLENHIRSELDRLPFEAINDMAERTTPIQGGCFYLVDWDNRRRSHTTIGELAVTVLHPKQVIPQPGVFTSIADMDYCFLIIPQTKESIWQMYRVPVYDEGESEPDVRVAVGSDADAEDMVSEIRAYYRNKNGGIGLYTWVNDVVLTDLDDYQARRLRRCEKCGATEPLDAEALGLPSADGEKPQRDLDDLRNPPEETPAATLAGSGQAQPTPARAGGERCPYCGGKFTERAEDYENIYSEMVLAVDEAGNPAKVVPGAAFVTTGERDEFGEPVIAEVPTRLPYYKPNVYPIVRQRSVSVYGQFLGDSDADKIASQQNTMNRLSVKAVQMLLTLGTKYSLPNDLSNKATPLDMDPIYLENAAQKQMIDTYDMQGDISQIMVFMEHCYESARQITGITESFQGRKDETATSGKAKEFAAAQTAGRLESKRLMKAAAYAELFEVMAKFALAYTDEPRPVPFRNAQGSTEYAIFDRYQFLEQDDAGEWYWNDEFLFACDSSAPLASNREALWQETRMNLQTGAFGDPNNIDTLILFWTIMSEFHYPLAKTAKAYLEQQREQQQMLIQQQMAQQQAMQAQSFPAAAPPAEGGGGYGHFAQQKIPQADTGQF